VCSERTLEEEMLKNPSNFIYVAEYPTNAILGDEMFTSYLKSCINPEATIEAYPIPLMQSGNKKSLIPSNDPYSTS
jgi:hypothetical protein